jgi:hypothetical protein
LIFLKKHQNQERRVENTNLLIYRGTLILKFNNKIIKKEWNLRGFLFQTKRKNKIMNPMRNTFWTAVDLGKKFYLTQAISKE